MRRPAADGVARRPADAPAPRVQLKWPNDLLLNDGKVGGVLAEVVLCDRSGDGRVRLIIGIGLNVNVPAADLAAIQRPVWPATSLLVECGAPADVELARVRLCEAVASRMTQARDAGFASLLPELNARQALRGRRIVFSAGGDLSAATDVELVRGVQGDFQPDGALEITLDGTHERRRFYAGELVHAVRGADDAAAGAERDGGGA